jgi:hypothetical protein
VGGKERERERFFIDGYGWTRGMGGLVEWVGLFMGGLGTETVK